MSELLPFNTSIGDLCTAALQECGRLGIGQVPNAEDTAKAWARAQWMLQQWERKRWLVYHLVTYSVVATGQQSYTFGPGGEINTNSAPAWYLEDLDTTASGVGYAVGDVLHLVATPPIGAGYTAAILTVTQVSGGGSVLAWDFTEPGLYTGPLPQSWTVGTHTGVGVGAVFAYPKWGLSTSRIPLSGGTVRPGKLESAFLRQIQNSQPNQVDYPMGILQSMEDYNKISLKSLQSFPGSVFLDSQWPLATLFCYPVPQANIYSINVTVREQLPLSFPTYATAINLPLEYYYPIS